LYPNTGTPAVSRYSNVASISKIAFGPAHTTNTGVLDSSGKSAEISNGASLCTPPIPPVANTLIPDKCAAIIDPATVVPPLPPVAIIGPKSLRLTFHKSGVFASSTTSAGFIPISTFPCRIPMVAGTAPSDLIIFSTSDESSIFCGNGSPWVTTVVSNATTGLFVFMAEATSSEILKKSGSL